MKENVKKCRFCGKEIAIITWGVYRKIVVDAEAVWIVPDEEGDEFVRIDGSKMRGRKALAEEKGEPAYRIHRMSCGVDG